MSVRKIVCCHLCTRSLKCTGPEAEGSGYYTAIMAVPSLSVSDRTIYFCDVCDPRIPNNADPNFHYNEHWGRQRDSRGLVPPLEETVDQTEQRTRVLKIHKPRPPGLRTWISKYEGKTWYGSCFTDYNGRVQSRYDDCPVRYVGYRMTA